MPDEPIIEETPEEVIDTSFQEYAVEVNGETYTVLEPSEPNQYRCRVASNGIVTGFAAHSGEPSEANAAADIAYALANPSVPAPVVRQLSKLELKARLDSLGKWSAFVTFLTSIGAWDDFILASFVSTDHPLFTTYAPQVKEGISLTDEEFDALIA
jgi:hypothetical protein